MGKRRLAVAWGTGGEVSVELTIADDAWGQIEAGEEFTLRGGGYVYDGQEFLGKW
jgi:hypothetical protein